MWAGEILTSISDLESMLVPDKCGGKRLIYNTFLILSLQWSQ